MQVKEVLLRAMNKEYSWLRAAEILGITPRGLRRLRQRMERFGYEGLVDMAVRPTVSTADSRWRRSSGFWGCIGIGTRGFNARHFCSTVRREHGVKLSYTPREADPARGGADGET